MSLCVLGFDHKVAPITIREKIAFTEKKLPHAYQSWRERYPDRGIVILSTCNRTEVYAETENIDGLLEWLADSHQLILSELKAYSHHWKNEQAVRHLLEVSAGLDSIVLGEPQILGQVKDAWRFSFDSHTTNAVLNKLFQHSFSVAKQIRTETSIGNHSVSYAAAGVGLAQQIFPSLADTRVLLVGVSQMTELAATHFAAQAPRRIAFINRTFERAKKAALSVNSVTAEALELTQLSEVLFQFDIVISAAASPIPLIGKGMVAKAVKQRRQRPMLMLDLAVPRNIEPSVDQLENIFLYCIDDVIQITEAGLALRKEAALSAQHLIDQGVEEFMQWYAERLRAPLIQRYRDQAEIIRQICVVEGIQALENGQDAKYIIERLSQRLTNKLLHTPTRVLAELDDKHHDYLTQLLPPFPSIDSI